MSETRQEDAASVQGYWEQEFRKALVKIKTLEAEVKRLTEGVWKIANEELDQGDLTGLGEEVMLDDAIRIATELLEDGGGREG